MFVESFLDSCSMGEGPAPCRQCHPWTGSTWCIRSRLSNVVISIPSQSPASFCSCLQGPPSLTSCPDFSPWWSVNSDGINPFLSKILFVMMVFLTVIESQLEWYLSCCFSNYYKMKKKSHTCRLFKNTWQFRFSLRILISKKSGLQTAVFLSVHKQL